MLEPNDVMQVDDKDWEQFKKEAVPSKIADKLGGIETKNGLHVVKDGRV